LFGWYPIVHKNVWGDFVVSRFAVEGKSIESEFK
jgi:hypothetical protein